MRLRRGLSPRTEAVVGRLSEQEIEDLLTAMPFLGPILPVLGAAHASPGPLASSRTPRKGSKGKLTPRSSARGTGSVADSHSYKPQQGASGCSVVEYQLTLSEMELASKAWAQVLASGSSGPSSAAEGATSPSKSGGASASVVTAATLFTKACAVASHLSNGRQLLDMLRLLHVPVTDAVEGLLDAVVMHLGSTGGSAGGATNEINPTNSTAVNRNGWLHFSKYLQFLCACKHLSAIRRHRYASKRGVSSPSRMTETQEATGTYEDGDDDVGPQQLELVDLEVSFEHLAASADGLLQGTTDEGSDDINRSGAASPSHYRPVTVESLQAFAASFDLSIEAVIPRHFLTPPPATPAPPPAVTAGSEALLASPKRAATSMGTPTVAAASKGWSLNPGASKQPISLEEFASHVTEGAPLQLDFTSSTAPDSAVASPTDADANHRVATSSAMIHKATGRLAATLRLAIPQKKDNTDKQSATHAPVAPGGDSLIQTPSHIKPSGARAPSTAMLAAQLAQSLPSHATWAEKRSPLSTNQLPPLTYLSFVRSKEEKREFERERREREHRLREEYLYGPPRPKPHKRTAEEESLFLLQQATNLVEEQLSDRDLFSIDTLRHKIRSRHEVRRAVESKEANRYAFLMPGYSTKAAKEEKASNRQPIVMPEAVRKATAQELLSMIRRCPDDSILGAQSTVRREQRRRGLNGTPAPH